MIVRGRPWPKIDTVEVTKTTEDGKPLVTKRGYFPEALDFARQLRERVVMAEGRHEKEQHMRANADARLAAATE